MDFTVLDEEPHITTMYSIMTGRQNSTIGSNFFYLCIVLI